LLTPELTKNREDLLKEEVGPEVFQLICKYVDLASTHTAIQQTQSVFEVKSLEANFFDTYINLERINDIRNINKFFEAVNSKLPNDGILIGCVETSRLRKARILKKYPRGLSDIYYFLDFLLKRVFPKLSWTKRIYFMLTGGRNRVLSKTEALGRLYSCGFEVLLEKTVGPNLFFFAKKSRAPYFDKNASFGPIFKMKRVGKNGKIIYCYKFRTMHPYSEYLQEYVYKKSELVKGDKIKDDPRVTTLGKFFRKYWIDELPMIYNLLNGDLKMVGVRPLSQHKLSLYDKDLTELRLTTKPGLVPPYYADMPNSFQGLMDSERKYLTAYKKTPVSTDIKYFFKAFYNIIFKKARSK
jgi:lipopolysaccharide/colanic/teichoic acid biosynthesis glycosyltransferase